MVVMLAVGKYENTEKTNQIHKQHHISTYQLSECLGKLLLLVRVSGRLMLSFIYELS